MPEPQKHQEAVKAHTAVQCLDYRGFAASHLPELLTSFSSRESGLTDKEAAKRLASVGLNMITQKHERAVVLQFLTRFANPLVAVLIVIAGFSFFLGDKASAILVS